jgi:hypothetical protein
MVSSAMAVLQQFQDHRKIQWGEKRATGVAGVCPSKKNGGPRSCGVAGEQPASTVGDVVPPRLTYTPREFAALGNAGLKSDATGT